MVNKYKVRELSELIHWVIQDDDDKVLSVLDGIEDINYLLIRAKRLVKLISQVSEERKRIPDPNQLPLPL